MQHVPHCGTFVALCSEIKHLGAFQSELELCDPPLRKLSFWPQPSWSTITPNRELNNSVACTQFPSIMYRGLLLKVLAPLLIMQRKMPLVVHSQSVIIEKRNYMQQGVDSQCVVIGGYGYALDCWIEVMCYIKHTHEQHDRMTPNHMNRLTM